MAPADINEEIKLLLDGFAATLNEGGMTMDDLVSVQVYCTDLSLYEKFNTAYAARFKKEFPARMFVGAGSLLRNGHFEMMGIAVKR
jgi:enamine deaminase RidA (YjgF/YER057c/UK114 family)